MNWSTPLPDLVSPPALPTMPCSCNPEDRGEMATPFAAIGATSTVDDDAPKSMRPAMSVALAIFDEVAVMPAAPMVRTPFAPVPAAVAVLKVLTCRLPEPPPLLFSTSPARVLSPKRFSVLTPFMVTMLPAAIWPATVLVELPMVTVALFTMRPLAAVVASGTVTPVAEASRLTVPPLITVPPV